MLINYGYLTHTHTHAHNYTVSMYPSNTLWLSNSPAVCLLVLYSLLCSLVPVLARTSPWHGPCWPSSADRAQQQPWGFFQTQKTHQLKLKLHFQLLHGSLVISSLSLSVYLYYKNVSSLLKRFASVHGFSDHSLTDAWHLTTATWMGQNEPAQGRTRILPSSAWTCHWTVHMFR